jgi:predicted transcriptional regulator
MNSATLVWVECRIALGYIVLRYFTEGQAMLTHDKTQVSLRVPNEMLQEFELVARALDRDRTWLMLRAFRQYLDAEGAEIIQEAEGLESLDRGEGVDFDEVLSKADAIISSARKREIRRLG